TPDQSLPANAIENSSATMILVDGEGSIVESFFISDGGSGDAPNRDGVAITVDHEIGTGGSGYPAGFYRVGDGASSFALLEYSPSPAPSATPGTANIPEPSVSALVTLFLGWMLLRRRRE
ncbi:MAG: PEP-CTERM sorting domain-containing protein, partial [Akkermansiaceae bacterium]|nr:PEP-CTERM sorting domain-containing protein [Akkermansiaceae bacterium]